MNRKLRIAQLVLPWITLPPLKYAGTEKIAYTLTEELVRQGHEVTLYSVGDSQTSANLSYIYQNAFGLQKNVNSGLKSSFSALMHVAACFDDADKFDIIHSHAQFLALPFSNIVKTPTLHTFHRSFEFDQPDDYDLVNRYKHLNFNSISDSQRVPNINFIATVYNGIDTDTYIPDPSPRRDYLLWIGRVIDKKGPLEAIEVSKRLSIPLVMVGKITDEEFYQAHIKPHIDGNSIKFIEDPTQTEIVKLFQHAQATLVPIKWNEPFGLIIIESMACGTPVVAFDQGAASEIITPQTGYCVPPSQGIPGLADAVSRIDKIDTAQCRQHVVQHFSINKMTENYLNVYTKLLSR